MIVDTSAFLAILQEEPEAKRFVAAVESAMSVATSAFTVFEAHAVLMRRHGQSAVDDLSRLVQGLSVSLLAFDERQSTLATEAYRRFGKGSGHPAQLNLGDCASYALAVSLHLPLLYKGEDFSRTDVKPAV